MVLACQGRFREQEGLTILGVGVTLVRTRLNSFPLSAPGADGRSTGRRRCAWVQEARAGDGVVDLRLGSPRRPVLREGRCQQRIQLGPRVDTARSSLAT